MTRTQLRCKPPAGRALASLENHYHSEKAIADRLRASVDREERKRIMSTMYDELFLAVPDHPRLTRRADALQTQKANDSKLRLLRPFVSRNTVVAEFGAGDCLFATTLAKQASYVYAIDISDQRPRAFQAPANFAFVCYDGYDVPEISGETVDLCFSDMLLEHLHPDDVQTHLSHVNSLLRPGGLYVFRTPHAQSGPDDVSKYFSDVAQGFHLKEWTYLDIVPVLQRAGFTRITPYWNARTILFPLPQSYCRAAERTLSLLPAALRPALAKLSLPSVCCVATKSELTTARTH